MLRVERVDVEVLNAVASVDVVKGRSLAEHDAKDPVGVRLPTGTSPGPTHSMLSSGKDGCQADENGGCGDAPALIGFSSMSRWQVVRSRSRSLRHSARGYARTFTLTDGKNVARSTVELLTGGSIFVDRRTEAARAALAPFLNEELPPRRVVVDVDGRRRVLP